MRYRRTLRYEPLEDRRLLATVTVNTLADTIDLNDGLTSLREAIFATNLVAGPDAIQFAASLTASGTATILLSQGELAIADDLTITGPATGSLTIDATAGDPTPDQNNGDGSRVFKIDDGSDASLIDVSVAGLILKGGDVLARGGAILNRENLTLSDSEVSSSAAVSDDVAVLSSGGGIAHSLGRLVVTNSVVVDNTADFGGGIHVESGSLVVDRSIIAMNSSVSGSGIYHASGDAAIARSWIHANTAGAFSLGGGIYNSGNLRIDATSISGNTASFGAGIFNRTDVDEVTLISHSTISGNSAFDRGGGVRNAAGLTVIFHSTITGNQAPPGDGGGFASRGYDTSRTEILSTIIAGNENGDVDFGTGDLNTFVSLGYNLIGTGNAIAEFDAAGDRVGIADPLLGPLADNGGPTLPDGSHLLTHSLLPGSPAINAGDLNLTAGTGGLSLYDQRGEPFARIVNGRIDIGAYEFQEASDLNLLVDALVDESDGNFGIGDLSLREAIELSNHWPSTDTIRFDPALTAARPASILLKMGELKIIDDVTIEGPGAKLLTIDASGLDSTPQQDKGDGGRVFHIEDGQLTVGIDVLLSGMMLTGGDAADHGGAIASFERLILRESWIVNNSAQMSGGGVYEVGPITITNSRIVNNLADIGGGAFVAGHGEIASSLFIDNSARSAAGAVHAGRLPGRDSRSGSLKVTNSEFENNSAVLGGAIQTFFPATITSSRFRFNSASDAGGAIWSSSGFSDDPITVTRSEFTQNFAQLAGGAMYVRTSTFTQLNAAVVEESTFSLNRANNGGGIYVDGNVLITGSQFVGNSSADDGGAVYLEAIGNLTIEQTRIVQNIARRHGGGIYSDSKLNVLFSEVLGNRAEGFEGSGGGIYSRRGLSLISTAVGNNFATEQGGGIFHTSQSSMSLIADSSTVFGNHTEGLGGGLFLGSFFGGTIVNSTFSANSANLSGGGIGLDTRFGRPLHILHSTIVHNSSDADLNGTGSGGGLHADGPVQISHSILAMNLANGLPSDSDGTPIQSRYSLIGYNVGSGLNEAPAGAPDANGNRVGGPMKGLIDPLVGPLADHGGPTMTHEMFPGSPALNAGDPVNLAGVGDVPQFDQRGRPFTRKFGERIDIGAFELQPNPLVGDYNFSGLVDAADYVLWRSTRGSTTDLRADGNGDGVVNDADRLVWRTNFGRTAGSMGQEAGSLKFESIAMAPKPPALLVADVRESIESTADRSFTAMRRRAINWRLAKSDSTGLAAFDEELLSEVTHQRAIGDERSDFSWQSHDNADETARDDFDARAFVFDRVFDAIGAG